MRSWWMADSHRNHDSTCQMRDLNPEPIYPLCIACKNGDTAMVDCLLQNGADVAFADDSGTPLLFVVERLVEQPNSKESDPIVALLLQHNAVVNVVGPNPFKRETPLYVACMKGLAGVVKQLLDCTADVDLTTSNWNKHPLLIACEKNFRDIAMMLLKHGANANVSEDKQTPLKLASEHGDVELVKQLLSCGADVNQMQNISDTALHAAVVGCKGLGNEAFVEIVQMLLKSGAKANLRNGKSETPLYLACRPTDDEVNVDIAQTLLEHGADPNDVLPPLSAAVSCGNNELVMFLIKFGARLDRIDDGRTALHLAIIRQLESTKNDTSTAEILLSSGADVNVMDRKGNSPLYLACDSGKTDFVKLLLSHGGSPNTVTTDKHPIHAACRGQHYDSVKLLLEYNADVTVPDENGKTALHHALESAFHHSSDSDKITSLVQLLLDRGANVNAVSKYEESPFYIVCSKGMISIAKKMLLTAELRWMVTVVRNCL